MNKLPIKQMIFAIVTMTFTITFFISTLSNVLAYEENQNPFSIDGICNHNSLSNQNTEIRTFGPNQPIIGLGNQCNIS